MGSQFITLHSNHIFIFAPYCPLKTDSVTANTANDCHVHSRAAYVSWRIWYGGLYSYTNKEINHRFTARIPYICHFWCVSNKSHINIDTFCGVRGREKTRRTLTQMSKCILYDSLSLYFLTRHQKWRVGMFASACQNAVHINTNAELLL